MALETVRVSRWPGSINSPVRLLLRAGIGLSFIVATLCPTNYPQIEKHYSSHTVDQPGCHSEHRNDKITKLASSVRQCKGCGQHQELPAFASKGRDRPSALCKSCDNKRRRSSYSPRVTAPNWDNVFITVETAAETVESDFTNVLLELLTEFSLVEDLRPQNEVLGIDAVIMGRNSLNDLLGR